MDKHWNSILFENAPYGVAYYKSVVDSGPRDLLLQDLNPAFEKIAGKLRSQIVEKLSSDLQADNTPGLFLQKNEIPTDKSKFNYRFFSEKTKKYYLVCVYLTNNHDYLVIFNETNGIAKTEEEKIDSVFAETMTSITRDTSKVTGEVYFQRLILNIHLFLKADYVLLIEPYQDKENLLKTFAACHHGKAISNFDIDLSNSTFYEELFNKLTIVKDQYETNDSENDLIIFNGIIMESYISIPLLDKGNTSLGVLMIFFYEKIDIPDAYIELVKIFASRAAAEKERLVSEAKIIESENKFRILADYNYEWEYWIGNKGKYVYVSPSCHKITGYKPEEFLNNPELLDQITLPEYKRELEEQAPNALSADLFHNSIEIRITNKSGNIRWINRTCNLLYDNKGDYLGIRGSIRDVTQKKQMELALSASERKFRNIFNISQEGIVISDFQDHILELNKSFSEMINSSDKEIKNIPISKFIHALDHDNFVTWKKSLSHIGNTIETRIDTSEGTITMEVSGKVIDYTDGQAHLTIFRDITDRKTIQSKILNTIIATEEKERMRIAQDLHDGMGPLLSTIKLYVNSILNARDDENKKIAIDRSIETVNEAILSLKSISNNLSPHILRDFGLIVAVESFIKRFKDTSDIEIEFISNIASRFNPNYEVTLFRIIIEFINNTYKHAKADLITINLDNIGDILELKYTDNGKGFDYQKVKQTPDGNGLFNIISRIESIDGDIWFNTQPGKGFKTHIIISEIFSQM